MPPGRAEEQNGPPYVDEHRITIAAPPAVVWVALRRYAGSLGVAESHPLSRLLGTEPPSGFEVTEEIPSRHLSLTGRHRFARYRLAFDLADEESGRTLLSATTYAAFPGPRGRVYRALVIGSRGHVVAVRHMLRTVRRLSLGPADPVRT